MKRILGLLLAVAVILSVCPFAFGESEALEFRILFTHDIHSHLDVSVSEVRGVTRERGDVARLKTLLDEYSTENSIYVDGGDFSQGTLFQTGYTTDAYELRALGLLGCTATTIGNHEWDVKGEGLAKMLTAAKASGDPLPRILASNLDLTGELTEEQEHVRDALNAYEDGYDSMRVTLPNGVVIGIFGLSGYSSNEDAPTAGVEWVDYIEQAKITVAELKEDCDFIMCLSHCGTNSDAETGEDVELLKAVPDIDFIVSAHSHSYYEEPVYAGNGLLCSTGEYLEDMGVVDFEIKDGKITCTDYRVIPVDENVEEDAEMRAYIDSCKVKIKEDYLKDEDYDDVLMHSDYDVMSIGEMYAATGEYPMGNMITDAYRYAAKQNGMDVDVAFVALGTIRGAIREGDTTVSNAFDIVPLGSGTDGSAGHPLLYFQALGKDIKMLAELDVSFGGMMSDIRISYSGLEMTYNPKRMLLDRITDIKLVREDGTREEIKDDEFYTIAVNMYGANMLGMLNGLTKGLITLNMYDFDGNIENDTSKLVMYDANGGEIKEWRAFAAYISSFEKDETGVSKLPDCYREPQGRKNEKPAYGLSQISRPGAPTLVVILVPIVIVLIVVITIVRKKKKKDYDLIELDSGKWN